MRRYWRTNLTISSMLRTFSMRSTSTSSMSRHGLATTCSIRSTAGVSVYPAQWYEKLGGSTDVRAYLNSSRTKRLALRTMRKGPGQGIPEGTLLDIVATVGRTGREEAKDALADSDCVVSLLMRVQTSTRTRASDWPRMPSISRTRALSDSSRSYPFAVIYLPLVVDCDRVDPDGPIRLPSRSIQEFVRSQHSLGCDAVKGSGPENQTKRE